MTLKIEYEASSFPASGYSSKLAGEHTLKVDWREIVWAAITVGKKNKSHIAVHGMYSCCEIINRSSLIWMSLRSTGDHLKKTDTYLSMDPTEKVFVSFSLGMTMAKLFSARLLDTAWLEHVSNVNHSFATISKTKSRPDLIGLDSNRNFIIVEAKGRTNNLNKAAQRTAKLQTKVISTIDGQTPKLRVASQSYFNNELKVALEDPEEISENSIEIAINQDAYLRSYYEIFAALSTSDLKLLRLAGIELDFTETLKNAFSRNTYANLVIENHENHENDDGFMCFKDGIRLKLTSDFWSDKSLNLQPTAR